MESRATRLEFYIFVVALVIFVTIWWGAIYANDRDDTKAIEIQVNGLQQVSGDTTRAIQSINKTVSETATQVINAMTQSGEHSQQLDVLNEETAMLRTSVDQVSQVDDLVSTQSSRFQFDVDYKQMQRLDLTGYIGTDKKSVRAIAGGEGYELVDADDNTKTLAIADVEYYSLQLEFIVRENDREFGTVTIPRIRAERIHNTACMGKECVMFSSHLVISPVMQVDKVEWAHTSLNPKESVIMIKYQNGADNTTLDLLDMGLLDQFQNTTNAITGSQIRAVELEAFGPGGDDNTPISVKVRVDDCAWRKQVTKSSPSF